MNAIAQLNEGALFAGRFRIERVIGRGGMGTVYEVVEEATGERHALKVLAQQLVSDPQHRARFAKEATISAEIRSAHIVPVVDAGVDEESDTPWLTMELLRGESLKAFVRARGKLDEKLAADVLGQVAEGLAAAHAAGVIHRDLKPDNVFVTRAPDGSLDVRVLDFGIAKLVSETIGRTTGAMGSPLWMAPEEAKKEVLTPAADVWAFGLLAFYVLTGSPIWRSAAKGSNIAQALHEVLIEPIPNPVLRAGAAGVTLPRGFEEWFGGCVVRDETLRFQDVADAWSHLGSVLLLPPPPPSPVPPPPARAAPPALAPLDESTKRWLVIGGSVALAVAVFGFVATTVGGAGEAAAGATSASTPPSAPAPEDSVLAAPRPVASAPTAHDTGDPVLSAAEACLAKNDLACAHGVLEPVAFGESPSAHHVQVLYDLCDLETDTECMTRIAKQHPKVNRRADRERTLSTPGIVSLADQARHLMVNEPFRARALLQFNVSTGKATPEEADVLWTICRAQKDTICTGDIADNYPNLPRRPPPL